MRLPQATWRASRSGRGVWCAGARHASADQHASHASAHHVAGLVLRNAAADKHTGHASAYHVAGLVLWHAAADDGAHDVANLILDAPADDDAHGIARRVCDAAADGDGHARADHAACRLGH